MVSDVCTFSHWLKTLKELKNKSLRNEYVKLMILALQHVKPMCPFKDPPPDVIEPLESGVKTNNININLFIYHL